MADTKIEWADVVWNPVTGCSPVSEGCEHCYAQRMAKRLAGRFGYPKDEPFRVTFHEDRIEEPLYWKKPRRIFVCSMGDLFHRAVRVNEQCEVFDIMRTEQRHEFLVLTKRARNMASFIEYYKSIGNFWPYPNVWLGVSVENQKRADERIPELLKIPGAQRFVSIEPMLGPVSISGCLEEINDADGFSQRGLDWVIVGGETGPNARPMHPDWARSIRDQCRVAGVPFFFKHMSGREEAPADLRIREFPFA